MAGVSVVPAQVGVQGPGQGGVIGVVRIDPGEVPQGAEAGVDWVDPGR